MPPAPWLHHVSLTVTDLDRSAEWYRTVLGLDEAGHRDGPSWRKALLRSGDFLLALTAHDGTQGQDRFDETRVGLDHVAVGCRDRAALEAWLAQLDEAGVARSPVTEAPHAHLFTCRDPDGIPVEFYWLVA